MFYIGLENGSEGRSQAWVLGHPGCFVYGDNGSAALQAIPEAIRAYHRWITDHTTECWLDEAEIVSCTYQLEETWECYSIDADFELAADGYEVNSWFRHDWKPLSQEEIRRGKLLLDWGRAELLTIVASLSTDILERLYPNERWSISGILKHIGGAEWWYLHRLGLAFPKSDVPDEPFQRLEVMRTHLMGVLPQLTDSTQVVGIDGEFWSPRKLLRRAVWHEYDHIAHIRKLI